MSTVPLEEQKITVIYHRADFDGLFCREIAKKFLPDHTVFIGWDHGDAKIPWPVEDDVVFILDINPDCLDETTLPPDWYGRIMWIDHHKSAFDKWDNLQKPLMNGYRIDGVAACRLTWQWFASGHPASGSELAFKEDYINRTVKEPLAVRLAGEYDIWDKRDPRAETFQMALRSEDLTETHWRELLNSSSEDRDYDPLVGILLENGKVIERYQRRMDAGVMDRSFTLEFEGLKFLALNTAWCNSLTFGSMDDKKTGHDALMGFMFNGLVWKVSLYHARHRTDLDLSVIAVKYGGGGHRGACGFQLTSIHSLLP